MFGLNSFRFVNSLGDDGSAILSFCFLPSFFFFGRQIVKFVLSNKSVVTDRDHTMTLGHRKFKSEWILSGRASCSYK